MPRRDHVLDRLRPTAALLLTGAVLHGHQLLGDRTFVRDTHRFYAPAKHYLAEMLRGGELPQWWPWDGLGSPFLAQPMWSTFHPTTLLYRLLPFWTAFAAQDLVGTWLALGGAYLLARALKQPRSSAFLAACLYAGNGYVMGLTEHTFMKLSAGTMPWYLWALLLAVRKGGGWVLAPAGVLGTLLLAGDPQIAILSSAAGLALAIADRPSRRALLLGLLSPAGAATLAAIQLIPSVLMIPETVRDELQAASAWAFDLPHFVGMLVPLDVWGFALHMELGLAAFALAAAAGSACLRNRKVAVLFTLALVSIWLAAGDAYGLNALARVVVPMWSKLRYPIKSIVLATLALALLAGEGLRQLQSARRRSQAFRSAMITAGGLAAFAGLLLPTCGGPHGAALLAELLPACAITVAAVLLSSRSRRLQWLAVVLVSVEVVSFGVHALPVVAPSFYTESPLSKAMRADGVGLRGPAFDLLDDDAGDIDSAPFHLAAAGGGSRSLYGALYHLPALTSYMPGMPRRLHDVWDKTAKLPVLSRFFGIFGVRDIVTSAGVQRFGPGVLGFDRVVATEPVYGYAAMHLSRSLPRAYSVRKARVIATAGEAGRILRSDEFKPGREVLIEGPTARPDWSERPEAVALAADVVSRTNSSVSIDADLPYDGFVVLNETFFKGWRATIDGQAAPVLVANGFVRAVEVPAGHHRVEFRFKTPGLVAGAAVSAAAWLAWLAAVGLARGRRRA